MKISKKKRILICTLILIIILIAFYTRSAGLFRGLGNEYVFHPDSPKQVTALWHYLNYRYVWYLDSPYYDGYPYGLNHLDEWIIRSVYNLINPLYMHLFPTSEKLGVPSGFLLYCIARILRLIYSISVLIITFFVAKYLLHSWWYPLTTIFLLAIAPLSYTVTHAATGDIGINLFLSAMLLVLCFYSRYNKQFLLIIAGLFCGFAFASKYQGALGFFIIISYLFLQNRYAQKKLYYFITNSFLPFFGFISGTIIATPAFFINAKQTFQDMYKNFIFIKNSTVDEIFSNKPFFEKMWLGLSKNIPFVVTGLGIIFFFLAIVGVIFLTVNMQKTFKRKITDKIQSPPILLLWTISIFPFFVLLISTSLKINVQIIHFSFLELPLCLGASYALMYIFMNFKIIGKIVSPIFFLIAVFEMFFQMHHEMYFWSRQDSAYAAKVYAENICNKPLGVSRKSSSSNIIKKFFLEKGNISIFRNGLQSITYQEAHFWERLQIAPVPSIPFPFSLQWIFINGPVFPRNDRMFEVKAGKKVKKELVFYEKIPEIYIGIRSSNLPLEAYINLGGTTEKINIEANSQKMIKLSPFKWKKINKKNQNYEVYIVPITITSKLGNSWITVLSNEKDRIWYNVFGAHSLKGTNYIINEFNTEEIVRKVKETAYFNNDQKEIHLIVTNGLSISPKPMPLAAGEYILECEVVGFDEKNTINIEVKDPAFLYSPSKKNKKTFQITKGRQTIVYSFFKQFAPYEINIYLENIIGNCAIGSWRLLPDTKIILQDLSSFFQTGKQPLWFSHYPSFIEYKEKKVKGVSFGEILTLTGFIFPEEIVAGEKFEYGFRFHLLNYNIKDILEVGVFVQLLDKNNNIVKGYDFALNHACFGKAPLLYPLHGIVPKNVKPGTYNLAMGIFNTRTRKRFPISAGKGNTFKIDKKAIIIQNVIVRR